MRRCFILLTILACILSTTAIHAANSTANSVLKKQHSQTGEKYTTLKHTIEALQKQLNTLKNKQETLDRQHATDLKNNLQQVTLLVDSAKDQNNQHATWMNLLLVSITVAITIIALFVASASFYFSYNAKAKLAEVRELANTEIEEFKNRFSQLKRDIKDAEELSNEISMKIQTNLEVSEMEKEALMETTKSQDLPPNIVSEAEAAEAYANKKYSKAYHLYLQAYGQGSSIQALFNAGQAAGRYAQKIFPTSQKNAEVWINYAINAFKSAKKDNPIFPSFAIQNMGLSYLLLSEMTKNDEMVLAALRKSIQCFHEAVKAEPDKATYHVDLLYAAIELAALTTSEKEKYQMLELITSSKEAAENLGYKFYHGDKARYACIMGDITTCYNEFLLAKKDNSLPPLEIALKNRVFCTMLGKNELVALYKQLEKELPETA